MTKLNNDKQYNCTVHYDDGDVAQIFAANLKTHHLDYFEGWKCEAGHSRIYIYHDGRVWGGECENDYLGSLADNTFSILQTETTCKKNRCIASADELMLRKYMVSK